MAILQRLTYKREYANINIFSSIFARVFIWRGKVDRRAIYSFPTVVPQISYFTKCVTFECTFARYLPKSNATLGSEKNFQEHFELGPNIPDGVSRPPTCDFINY